MPPKFPHSEPNHPAFNICTRLRSPALMVSLALAALALPVRGNVYPTNVKLNDSFTNVTVAAGTEVRITYILNEPASGGVTIRVLAGNTTARTITLAAGAVGTLRGTNTVIWDGKGADSNPVAVGSYSVAITAASRGYPVWTQTTDDAADGNNVWEGRGIAVDRNTNSLYYGRIFVANAQANDPGTSNWLGYQVGILKCNADASYANEGGTSTGGYSWSGDTYSPWHLEVASDDFVYVDDFTTNGQVIRFDATISTNSALTVLRPDNWPNLNVSLSGPAIYGSGTNTSLWMADAPFSTSRQGLGVLRYNLQANGACATGDTGITAVAVGGSLTGNPVDVALDTAGNLYTIQRNDETGDPANRVYRFGAVLSVTNGAPLTDASWAVGSKNDTMAGARGIAIDPTGTYVAVAFAGLSTGENGCTQILYATNGAIVTNLDLGVAISGSLLHEDQDCAWDAVGNVYYIDNYFGVWRAVSPPGTNQATTVALAAIQVTGGGPPVAPQITSISAGAGLVTIRFSAGTADLAAAFTLLSAATVNGSYLPAPNANVSQVSPGAFQATVPMSGPTQYYRIRK
jgi:hypothetical protein